MMTHMSESDVVMAWRSVIWGHARVIEGMSENVRAEYGVTLNEFEALLHVAVAEPILQKDLARRLTLTPGGVTRMLDRLVKSGWVVRSGHDADRRGKAVTLTREGRAQFERMNADHERDIERYFGAFCSADELRTITEVFGRVARRSME